MRLTHIVKLMITTLLLLSPLSFAKNVKEPVLGKWKVIDSRTGSEQGIIEIRYNAKTKTFYGASVKSKRNRLNAPCKKCPGKLKNKPYAKVPPLWNFKKGKKAGTYKNGYLLEYTTGKVFSGSLTVSKNGKRLKVRGSPVGAKFIGRTVYWLRAE